MKSKLTMLALAGSLCAPALAAEPAVVVRNTDMKAKPFTDAGTVAALTEGSKVNVMTRQTSWLEVKADANQGWVRLLSLRFEQPANAAKANAAGNPFLTALGKGGGGSVATTGVRGLTEERLTNPQPNPAALEQMQGYAQNAGDAAAFAARAGLKEQSFDYVNNGGRK